ncbi:MAG: hypothetical protein GY793_00735 [Proteobacteria bacterium]|nr:hypothetical protein [Pseudomonadota bacterium]
MANKSKSRVLNKGFIRSLKIKIKTVIALAICLFILISLGSLARLIKTSHPSVIKVVFWEQAEEDKYIISAARSDAEYLVYDLKNDGFQAYILSGAERHNNRGITKPSN